MNKAQHTTRYIKHLAESANFKGGTFNKHRNGLIGNRFDMPNVSYTHPFIRNPLRFLRMNVVRYALSFLSAKQTAKNSAVKSMHI